MRTMRRMMLTIAVLMGLSTTVFAHGHRWRDASGDEPPKSFREGYAHGIKRFDDGFVFFPGAEIGLGSGALSASLGINLGYKYGFFFAGTSLKGQVVNIDRVNYRFMPLTLNVSGLSVSLIPETGNDQNRKKLKGQSIGLGLGGKLSFA
jgi:hypothetical protein